MVKISFPASPIQEFRGAGPSPYSRVESIGPIFKYHEFNPSSAYISLIKPEFQLELNPDFELQVRFGFGGQTFTDKF